MVSQRAPGWRIFTMLMCFLISLFFIESESHSILRSSAYKPRPIGLPNSRPLQPPPRPIPAHDPPYLPPSGDLTDCPVGDYIPGPTCTSFYMCTGSIYAARRVKFECAPGTAFDNRVNVCVAGLQSDCFLELLGLKPASVAPTILPPLPPPSPPPAPSPPSPAPSPSPAPPPSPTLSPSPPPSPSPAPSPSPTLSPSPPPSPSPAPLPSPSTAPPPSPTSSPSPAPSPSPTLSPSPAPSPYPTPSPSPPPSPSPGPSLSPTCTSYVVAPGSAHKCEHPGNYPSRISCQLFYRCTITTSCRLMGTVDRCPADSHFDTLTRSCRKREHAVCGRLPSSLI